MGEEHIIEPGPEEMPYGTGDIGGPDELDELDKRRAAPTFPSRRVPGETEEGRPPGEGGVIGEEEEEEGFGGFSPSDREEIMLGGAETDAGQRGRIYPGGAAGSDFDFDAEPNPGPDVGGELGGDMDPDEEDWLP
jgi:hypothetical protein